jgi:hypothetical protein
MKVYEAKGSAERNAQITPIRADISQMSGVGKKRSKVSKDFAEQYGQNAYENNLNPGEHDYGADAAQAQAPSNLNFNLYKAPKNKRQKKSSAEKTREKVEKERIKQEKALKKKE